MRSTAPASSRTSVLVASLAACCLLAVAPARVLAEDLLDTTVAQLEMERELLAEQLRLFADARRQQQLALSRFQTALEGVDSAIEGRQVSVQGLEELERAVEEAEVELTAANRRATRWRQHLQDSLRRTALLENRAEALSRGPGVRVDPLSGRWRLEIEPDAQKGVLDLRFSANLITGFYALEDGSSASLRGTYSGGTLRLERVDALKGFDAVWQGEVDLASRTITGTWTATELSSGGPVQGTWRAVKTDSIGTGETP
ncbi:MAG: hypothetical protein KDD47_26320 [Acidobacteria bacterium]|nr:hypothetical protein [Acidobacteriota bacterium]